jgi:hypothetical protein
MIRHLSRRLLLIAGLGLILTGAGATAMGIAQQRASGAMATSANALLTSLTAEQRQKVAFPVASEEWTKWHFIPPSMFARNGLPLKDMTAPQQQAARALLSASLSQAGNDIATKIMANEVVTGLMEAKSREANVAAGKAPGQTFARDPLEYFVSIFGTPSATGQWGWRLEGHHVSLRFAVDGARTRVSSTPMFFGANPALVPEGFPEAGRRLLPLHEDNARALVNALDDTQKTTAIVGPQAAGDIATGTQVKPNPMQLGGSAAGRGGRAAAPPREVPEGLSYQQMNAAQRDQLMKLIELYTSAMLPEVATERMGKIREAGLDKIYFGWWGPTEKGRQYYYRIQGPTFLAEHNNTQGGGNHVHQVWRDFNGDFGRDVLAEHMAAYRH